ncbi:MAG: IS66 family transposase [Deltaproteobacteria bacterium]|nr:IS66 family transposase [Deltaproteobacteria bacterium]
MPSKPFEPDITQSLTISHEDWERTPPSVRAVLVRQQEIIAEFAKRIEELEARLGQNSQNSNRPPSSDPPPQRVKRKKSKGAGKPGAKKGHKGSQQSLLEPTRTVPVPPDRCACGCREFRDLKPFHTHQHIELPEIEMQITHFVLYEGECSSCGSPNKGEIPQGFQVGYGPRLTGFVGELSGGQRSSRRAVKDFCQSVLGVSISVGAIQRCVDRVSQAILPHYEAIAARARTSRVNHVDETPWYRHGVLAWLWVMVNGTVAFFSVKASRSKAAFEELIGHWAGILVSDGYGAYRKWVQMRQTCLAHLIRRAKGLSERADTVVAHFGERISTELDRLIHWAHAPPTKGEVATWYARMCHLINQHRGRKDEAGRFARHLDAEMGNLWVFLLEESVDPTNNRAERALRLAPNDAGELQ